MKNIIILVLVQQHIIVDTYELEELIDHRIMKEISINYLHYLEVKTIGNK